MLLDIWIGLEDRDGDGQYNWVSDGAPLGPALTNWAPPYPTPEVGIYKKVGVGIRLVPHFLLACVHEVKKPRSFSCDPKRVFN